MVNEELTKGGRGSAPTTSKIVGASTSTPRTAQTCIGLHRPAFGYTPPPAPGANAQVGATAVRGCGPGCRGFKSRHSPHGRSPGYRARIGVDLGLLLSPGGRAPGIFSAASGPA